jgi:glyoxylase-like metal-dependent hydrolase (beta-lactamase superfamily II)
MMTADALPSWPPEPDIAREVAPGVVHLLAPNASSWTYEGTNSYVLGDAEAAVLIDPGCEDAAHHEALRRAGRAGGRTVTGVLLTHDHPDHSDGARALAASLDVPIIAMSPRFADEFLSDGQVLRFGELAARVIHTPGHSDDSVCLWMPEQGTILTGDTLLGARSSGVMGTLSELLDSLERLRELVGEREVLALPGHGPAFDDLARSASRVIEVRTRRIDEVRAHIANGVTTLEGLTGLLYPSHSGSRAMFAISTVVSTVTYLTEQRGERGIADPAGRRAVLAELERYEQAMAERAREHDERQRTRKDERV